MHPVEELGLGVLGAQEVLETRVLVEPEEALGVEALGVEVLETRVLAELEGVVLGAPEVGAQEVLVELEAGALEEALEEALEAEPGKVLEVLGMALR
jgi:hypothetical protein